MREIHYRETARQQAALDTHHSTLTAIMEYVILICSTGGGGLFSFVNNAKKCDSLKRKPIWSQKGIYQRTCLQNSNGIYVRWNSTILVVFRTTTNKHIFMGCFFNMAIQSGFTVANTDMLGLQSIWLAHILSYTNQSAAANNKVLCIHALSEFGDLAQKPHYNASHKTPFYMPFVFSCLSFLLVLC